LAEEAGLGVPGGAWILWTILHPAPIGLPGQKEPEGFAHGSGEVGYGGVGGEDEVEGVDDGGGVGEVAVVGAGVFESRAKFGGDFGDLLGGGAFLEGDPVELGEFEEGEKGLEGGGTFAVGAVVGVAGPVEADSGRSLLLLRDLFLRPLTQLRGQGWGTRMGRREQIRDGGGDGFRGGLEEGWEAHERDVVGEGGDGVALGEDLDGGAGSGSFALLRMTTLRAERLDDEATQRWLDFQEDLWSWGIPGLRSETGGTRIFQAAETVSDGWQVAEELEGVSEALLGVEEESGCWGEGLALPAGLGEAAGVGVDFTELPADLVVLPAFQEVAGAELGEGEVVADAGVVGVPGEGCLVGLEGFFDTAQAEEGVAAVAGGGFVALEFGLVEGLDGLGEEVA
jgi:hypothetical protein